MTKQELELRVAELEKELVNLPKINEIKKREQELVQEAYDSKRD